MSPTAARLYAALPAVYRERDAVQGYPLRALIAVMAEQIQVMEDDLERLYDDLFIETCADWVVPYLGALVGVGDSEASRAEVANTMAYRRRKGTATVLEQLARDITGWPSVVVEYFQRLATTQYLNHLRPDVLAMPDLRRPRLSGTAFDPIPRTIEVRRIGVRRGRYNIANVGVHCWRTVALELNDVPPQAVDAQRYRFDPLGRDVALYNRPQLEPDIGHAAVPRHVPLPLTRALLAEDPDHYFGTALSVEIDGVKITPAAGQRWLDVFAVCNLMDFSGGWANLPTRRIAVDPELGRLAFPADATPAGTVRVSWLHGAAAQLGGGSYPRQEGFSSGPVIPVAGGSIATLQTALDSAAAQMLAQDLPGVVVEITDNAVYSGPLAIEVPAGRWMELRAAEARRPVLDASGDLSCGGGAGAELRLDGLLLAAGALRVPTTVGGGDNALRRLIVRHCTLAPAANAFDAEPLPRVRLQVATDCDVSLYRCISGALRASPRAAVSLRDSLIDAGDATQLVLAADGTTPAGQLDVRGCTLIGRVHAQGLVGENTVFHAGGGNAPLRIERLQQGCVRFCWVPPGSILPRRYRCLPDQAEPDVRPVFTSLHWGDAGYGQLAARCPAVILSGAADGGEMGVLHHLGQTRKTERLQRNLPEYLRLSLETGVFFES